jgi:hypothetical protein
MEYLNPLEIVAADVDKKIRHPSLIEAAPLVIIQRIPLQYGVAAVLNLFLHHSDIRAT